MLGFDLGSNTLRIVQIECSTHRRINVYEKIVRTAKDLHITGLISEHSKENIFNALHEASKLFDFKNEPCFCVTTEAMRVASNAEIILREIKHHFGLDFEIISGEKEAYLTSLAVENALRREGLEYKNYVLFDLGGGSTELTFCQEGKKNSKSFPFGIINVAERSTENLASTISEAVTLMDTFLMTHPTKEQETLQLVTTAGTPTTVAAFLAGLDYDHYDAAVVNGKVLHVKDFDEAYFRLTTMEKAEAERYTGTNRRELVIVGILLVKAIMAKLDFKSCVVIDDGLREGVVLEQCYNLEKLQRKP